MWRQSPPSAARGLRCIPPRSLTRPLPPSATNKTFRTPPGHKRARSLPRGRDGRPGPAFQPRLPLLPLGLPGLGGCGCAWSPRRWLIASRNPEPTSTARLRRGGGGGASLAARRSTSRPVLPCPLLGGPKSAPASPRIALSPSPSCAHTQQSVTQVHAQSNRLCTCDNFGGGGNTARLGRIHICREKDGLIWSFERKTSGAEENGVISFQ